MNLFLSYAHDDSSPAIVERVRAALEAAGHRTWFDTRNIKDGDSWRRSIVAGLQETDWSLLFLSRHGLRPEGVCLDEINIAIAERGETFTPILLEKIESFPTAVGHVQALDLSSWREAGQVGSRGFERWFAGEVGRILALLSDERVARQAQELARLRAAFRPPPPQSPEIERLTEGFVGREWLYDEVEAWRRGPRREPLLWLEAEPGMGKSAFAAWLARNHRTNVVAIRLCRYLSADRTDAGLVVRALIVQLATRLGDYRAALLKRLDEVEQKVPASPGELFSDWIITPLTSFAIDGGRSRDPFLLIVDGLDETLVEDRSPLAVVLRENAPRLPDWTRLLVTSRPESELALQFADAKRLVIAVDDKNAGADIAAYAASWLGPARANAVPRLVSAARGSMVYLRALRAAAGDSEPDLDDLPGSLVALFHASFHRQFPTAADYQAVRPLLDVLCAASLPLPMSILAAASGRTQFEARALLRRLGSLFPDRGAGVEPFHVSLKEWLGRPDAGAFEADVASGTQALLRALWPCLAGDDALQRPEMLRELQVQAERVSDSALEPLLGDEDRWITIDANLVRGAGLLRDRAERDMAMVLIRIRRRLAEAIDSPTGQLAEAFALHEIGGDAKSRDDFAAAQQAFLRTVRLLARLVSDFPAAAADLNPFLAGGLSDLGGVLCRLTLLGNAERAYRHEIGVRTELAAGEPYSPERQAELATSWMALAVVRHDSGDAVGAVSARDMAARIVGDLAAADPSSLKYLADQWQRAAMNEAYAKDYAPAATRMEIAVMMGQGWAADDPTSNERHIELASWRRRLAQIYHRKGDHHQAESVLLAQLDDWQQLAEREPSNVEWPLRQAGLWSMISLWGCRPGDEQQARSAFNAERGILEDLVTRFPSETGPRDGLRLCWSSWGRKRLEAGDLEGAEVAIRNALEISGRGGRAFDMEAVRDRADDWLLLAKVLERREDLAGAEAAYDEALCLEAMRADHDPTDTDLQELLASLWRRLGALRIKQDDLAGAVAAYEAALHTQERAFGAIPSDPSRAAELARSWNDLGSFCQSVGDADAEAAARKAELAIWNDLATRDPASREWQEQLAETWIALGKVRNQRDDLDGAIEAFEAASTILNHLPEPLAPQGLDIDHKRLDETTRQELRAGALEVLGNLRRAKRDLDGAAAAFTLAIECQQHLIVQAPDSEKAASALARIWYEVGLLRGEAGDLAHASEALETAASRFTDLCSRYPQNPEYAASAADILALVRSVRPRQPRRRLVVGVAGVVALGVICYRVLFWH